MKKFYVLHYYKNNLQVGKGYDTYDDANTHVTRLKPHGRRPFIVQVLEEAPTHD